ncbi:hypothetical protein M8J77_022388 [Diaphorina citri]|nr:hypothetical protein M8J77_022388 [Diaphorina citri]
MSELRAWHRVGDPNDTWIETFNDSLQSSHSNLRLRLKPHHFTRDGIMILRCTAVISTLYRNSSELQLVSKAKEPVPERGRPGLDKSFYGDRQTDRQTDRPSE